MREVEAAHWRTICRQHPSRVPWLKQHGPDGCRTLIASEAISARMRRWAPELEEALQTFLIVGYGDD